MSKENERTEVGLVHDISYSQCANLSTQLKALQQEIKADYVFIASVDEHELATTQLVLHNSTIAENFCFPLKGSPCEPLLKKKVCFTTHNLQLSYPENTLLQKMDVSAYLGAAILNEDGLLTGVLVGLYVNDNQSLEQHKSTLLSLQTMQVFTYKRAF